MPETYPGVAGAYHGVVPRTHLGNLLRRLQAEAEYARRIGLPAADAHDVMQEMSRRRFLKGSIGLGAATLLPALGCSSENTAPGGNVASGTGLRVAVVGAGLAGLTCAHRLVRAGANVTVYEASDRLGGRTRTVRGFFGDNRTAESGAEFVNSDHAAIRALIQELGLELEDLWTGYPEGADSVNSFDKAPYSRTDIANDWSAVAPAVRRDYAAAGTDIRWDNHTDAAIGLDRMSLAQWIDANVPDGRPSRMGRLIEITQLSEWAGSAEHQSALNFITTVGPGAGGAIDLLGGSDERWHVIGGSDRVAERLGEQIGPAAIQLGARLAAARTNGAGVRCTFDQAGSPFDVDADRVVLAVPFSTLRAVDLDGVQLSDRKRRVIADQPMGTNSKLHMEFGERAWRNDGADGDSISDTGLMVTWEGVITEPGPTGVLVAYNGGALRGPIRELPA